MIRVGDRVRIRAGHAAGRVGTVTGPPGRDDMWSVSIDGAAHAYAAVDLIALADAPGNFQIGDRVMARHGFTEGSVGVVAQRDGDVYYIDVGGTRLTYGASALKLVEAAPADDVVRCQGNCATYGTSGSGPAPEAVRVGIYGEPVCAKCWMDSVRQNKVLDFRTAHATEELVRILGQVEYADAACRRCGCRLVREGAASCPACAHPVAA